MARVCFGRWHAPPACLLGVQQDMQGSRHGSTFPRAARCVSSSSACATGQQLACPPLPPARRDGSIYAYAVSYDWSRGYSEYNPTTAKNYILLHAPQEAEVKSRNRPASTRR